MSSNKSWAQIAGKKTVKKASAKPADPARQSNMVDPQPIRYEPLIRNLAMLDVPCPRCKHKNHTVVLDDISDEERRPGCTECDACFPPTGTGMASSAGTQPAIYRKRKIPPHIVVVSSGASLPGAGFKLEESSTEHHPPDDPNADIKPPLEISPMLRECPSVPPAYDDTSAEDHISSPTSRIQPDMGSADFPNVVFFRDLKQKSRVAISAELFEGSAPDDGPCNGGLQPPIGSKKSTGADHTNEQL